MNLSKRRKHRDDGIMLLEAIVYVAVLALILGLAFSTFYTALTNHRNLTRNADDITRALKAGERWRADLRGALGAPRIAAGATATNVAFQLPGGKGDIVYRLRDGEISRRGAGETNEVAFLTGVASSQYIRDARSNVTVWRWEVELAGRQKVAGVRPLFSFQAVEPIEVKR